jgi:Gram-negative bacterial TonB protein C-terminal
MKRVEQLAQRTALAFTLLLMLASISVRGYGQPGSGFLYLSDQRIVTLEVVTDHSAVINYLNLAESYSMFIPSNLIIFGNQENWKRAQVIKNDDISDSDNRFFASSLINPGKVYGVEVMGDMKLEGEVEGACLRIEGRILIFEHLNKRDFEVALARISNIDLDRRNRKTALKRAGFNRGFGRMVFEGTKDSVKYEEYFMEDPVFGPVAVVDPKPLLPSAFRSLPDPVVVRVAGFISRYGGLKKTSVLEGINPILDEQALETVRASWQFLPAVQSNEVAEAEVKLNVVFRRD